MSDYVEIVTRHPDEYWLGWETANKEHQSDEGYTLSYQDAMIHAATVMTEESAAYYVGYADFLGAG